MFGFRWLRKLRRSSAPSSIAAPAEVVGFEELFGKSARSSETTAVGHVVIVGNCLAEGIHMGMSSMPAATRRYAFSSIPLHLRSLDDVISQNELGRATHVFAQRIGALDFDRLRKLIPAEARVIEYQDIVFRSAWPFEGENGFRDDALLAHTAGPIKHVDGALARLRLQEPDKKKRIQRYKDLDFDWAAGIDRVIETQKRFLASVDTGPHMRIGKFILENIQDEQLFYTSVHPAGALFQQYCAQLGQQLLISEALPSVDKVDHWRKWSIPIHPIIAERIGLKWAHRATLYPYGDLGEVTWQEWVEAYVETLG